jgi:excisionase family DNA binding protein
MKDVDEQSYDPSDGEFGWMSTKAAAAYLGITPRTLYRFVDEGLVPAYKMGRVFRLRRSDLDVFIDTTRVVPGSIKHLYPPRNSDPA